VPNSPPKRRRIPLPGDRATGFRNPVEKPRATPSAPDALAPSNWEDGIVVLDRVVTPESYRESLSPEERKQHDAAEARRKRIQEQREREAQQLREQRTRQERYIRQQRLLDHFRLRKGKESEFIPSLSPSVQNVRKGGLIKKYAKGGSVSSASKRADGCVTKGKTRGKFV
jgi:hypothetical protein